VVTKIITYSALLSRVIKEAAGTIKVHLPKQEVYHLTFKLVHLISREVVPPWPILSTNIVPVVILLAFPPLVEGHWLAVHPQI
jgi:hypothetical protein